MRDRQAALEAKRQALLEAGVDMMDPSSVYVEDSVQVGEGTLLLPGTILRGDTVVGRNCQIGPNVMLTSCTVEDECAINASQCEESVIRKGCQIGPYTHIRPHCVVGEGSKIGAFVQLKNCNLGKGTKMAHLTYVGDSDVGDDCNFGCGTVTCNYDGEGKYHTTIGDYAFIGCNTNLVAPVTVGDHAFTAAGSTIDHDVPAGALSIERAKQTEIDNWGENKLQKYIAKKQKLEADKKNK